MWPCGSSTAAARRRAGSRPRRGCWRRPRAAPREARGRGSPAAAGSPPPGSCRLSRLTPSKRCAPARARPRRRRSRTAATISRHLGRLRGGGGVRRAAAPPALPGRRRPSRIRVILMTGLPRSQSSASRSARRPLPARSLWATRLATKRAVQAAISSRTSRSFSCSVRPVATRSTIPSARPTSGASSTEPLTSITSAWRPLCSKWRSAIRGYLVAIRIAPEAALRLAQAGRRRPCPARTIRQCAEAEVEQLVDHPVGLLEQDVLAGDADVGGARLDVGRDVGGAHRDQR